MRDGVAIVSALLAVLVPGRSARRAGSYRRAGLLDHGDRAWRCTWTPPTTGVCGYASIQDHTTHQQALVQISSVRLYRTGNPDGGTWVEVANGSGTGWGLRPRHDRPRDLLRRPLVPGRLPLDAFIEDLRK
jgi:hypothetical protein